MDIKRIVLFLFFTLGCLSASCAENKSLPTIDEAADSYLTVLVENNHWRLFSITMPPESKLGDHKTGPRAIIPLTTIAIQRLEGSTELMKVPAHKALWLTNVESKGFRNAADTDLVYLVLEAKNRLLELSETKEGCQSGTTLLSYEKLLICMVEPEKKLEIQADTQSWVYVPESHNDELQLNGKAHQRPEQGVITLAAGKHKMLHKSKPLLLLSFKP